MKRARPNSPRSLENRQVGRMTGSTVHIIKMGKTLVHYKHVKADAGVNGKPALVRVPVSLVNKTVLEQLLNRNKAVLLRAQK